MKPMTQRRLFFAALMMFALIWFLFTFFQLSSRLAEAAHSF